jgi:AraC-like DNA-binding protein
MDGREHQLIGFEPRRVTFSDADGLAGAFRDWGVEALQLSRAAGQNWAVAARLEGLLLRATSVSGRYRFRGGTPARTVIIQFDVGSDGPRHFCGQALDGSDVVVAFGGAQFDYVSPDRHHGMNFGLPEATVVEALAQRAPGAVALMRSASLYVMSHGGPQTARVRALGAEIFRLGSQPLGLQLTEHAYGDLVDALVGTLLMPWDRETATTFRMTHYQRLPIVRRVEEFMRSNLGEPLMLHDICGVARASERAVEYAFRDVYGVGAKQYLKLLRLNQVRQELKGPLGDALTVKEIAQRFGFRHMGHFSTRYRQLFGETPQQTRGQRDAAPAFLEPVTPVSGPHDRISGWPDLKSGRPAPFGK